MINWVLINFLIIIIFSILYFYIELYENNEITPYNALYYSCTIHLPTIDNDYENKSTLAKCCKNIHNIIANYCYYSLII